VPGDRVKRLAGNCLEASARRLTVLRAVEAGALPGKSLVVYEPAHGLVRDGLPCEDGHAPEGALRGRGLATVPAGDLWSQARTFCPCALLGTLASRGAGFITPQHAGLPFAVVTPRRSVGHIEPVPVAEQRVQVRDAQGSAQLCRRLRVTRAQATRDGARVL
jgi:hypothetical protein